ncbi:MAG: hypothetical protein ACR2NM_11975 [Bythopirellula sp.]
MVVSITPTAGGYRERDIRRLHEIAIRKSAGSTDSGLSQIVRTGLHKIEVSAFRGMRRNGVARYHLL